MYIEKRIKLNTNIYYVRIEVEYKKHEKGFVFLDFKDYEDCSYDGGTVSLLIEELEKNYTDEKVKKYDKHIAFMADCLYIYDHIPCLSAIKSVYIKAQENLPYSIDYISKAEIDTYIKDNKVNMSFNKNLELHDEAIICIDKD